jgi:S1-C subfamily serine protease
LEQELDTSPEYNNGDSAMPIRNDLFGHPGAQDRPRAVLGAEVTGISSATGPGDGPAGVVASASSDRLSVGSEYRPVTVTSGAFVVGIEPGSPAYSAGIRVGDVILSFDEKTVDSPTALSEAIREQSPESRVVVSWIDTNGQYRRATVRFNNGPT